MTTVLTHQTDSVLGVGIGTYHMVKAIIDLIGASVRSRWQFKIIPGGFSKGTVTTCTHSTWELQRMV